MLTQTIQYFIIIMLELTFLFLVVSTIVALILTHVSQDKIKNWISKRGILGNIMGAFAGALTPFCACSTIPITLGLLKSGVSLGHTLSFLIASPLLNPIIIVMITTLMGIKAGILYFSTTFLCSVFFGLLVEKLGGSKHIKTGILKRSCCCSNEQESVQNAFGSKLRSSFITAWSDFRKVFAYLIIGVGVGSIIYGYIPQELIVKIAGPRNLFAIPIAAIVGIPLYIRAETAIPIGIALIQKGMGMGAVIALIIGGAGMAIPEITMLSSMFKWRLVLAIILVVFLTAVISGYLFNLFG